MNNYNNINHIILITSDDSFLIYDIPIGKTTKEIETLIENGENKLLTCQHILHNYPNNVIHVGHHSRLYDIVDYHIQTKINRKYIWKIIDNNLDKMD